VTAVDNHEIRVECESSDLRDPYMCSWLDFAFSQLSESASRRNCINTTGSLDSQESALVPTARTERATGIAQLPHWWSITGSICIKSNTLSVRNRNTLWSR